MKARYAWAVTTALVAWLIMGLAIVLPAKADESWSSTEMNRIIDQTNFIVSNGCSGTLISLEKKLILTNHHCVDRYIRFVEREEVGKNGKVEKVRRERRDRVNVRQNAYRRAELVGDASYRAEIVGYRKNRDLALLQIIADTIPHTQHTAVLPLDADYQRGDRVWAVGNPRGLDATVTGGFISSINRTFRLWWAENEDLPMIQYDAATNPGNSGGALYNSKGQLIGVPAAGYGGSEGLNLAVPIEMIREVLAENCFASLYDPEADDAACRDEKVETEEMEEVVE
jgi:S1-C subfamily serine protease